MRQGLWAILLLVGCTNGTLIGGSDLTPTSSSVTGDDFAAKLAAIPGMTLTSSSLLDDGATFYQLTFQQAVDHADASKGTFAQYLNIMHEGPGAPVVLYTAGYDAPHFGSASEPATSLSANQITVEHRYYGSSWPSRSDYAFATISQSVDDLHAIVTALRPLYASKWLSTGASKDGMTATYYRAAYPNDVDATIAYVAPLMLGTTAPLSPLDKRMNAYLDTAGTDACRANLHAFRRAVLQDPMKSQILELFAAHAQSQNLHFTALAPNDPQIALERAFDYAVIELNYTLWQYAGETECDSVPGSAMTAQDALDFLINVAWIDSYDDSSFNDFATFYYEALSELNYYEEYYGPDESGDVIADLLPFTPSWHDWVPPGSNPPYSAQAMNDMLDWQARRCNNVIFVYGEDDPYTQAAYQPGAGTNCEVYVAAGGNHGAGIFGEVGNTLSAAQQATLTDTLKRWTGLELRATSSASDNRRAAPPALSGRKRRPI